ncbi:unnamed protein product [Brassica rapa]|uniref:Uncharacterized protein n=1 Tax=Brassica campestris TaxID=3711 RepID=A0A3P5Z0C4_BRACM|nr:unnamed protein product [Brassica rapa]VDC66640.1 unnamed protein product [Brassica rapa]
MLLSWIRRELSCKSGILQGKSDFGLSRIFLLDSSYCYICILSLSSLWWEPVILTYVVSSYCSIVPWSNGNLACV